MPRQLKNQAGNWISVPWEEYVGADGSHGATFSTGWDGGNQATLQILVEWNDALQAELDLLGSAVFQGGNLLRTPPARHPYKTWLRAERILSAQPMRWDDKLQVFNNPLLSNPTFSPISEYAYFLLTIGFINPNYRILSDADLLNKYGAMQEWNRYCEPHQRIGVQMLSREGAQWKWLDGGGANQPVINNQLTAPVGTAIAMQEIHVKWKRVPRKGLMANNGESDMYNQNITNALNKVHNGATNLWQFVNGAAVALFNSNSNTSALRFVGVDSTPIPSPFDPIVQNLSQTNINQYFDVDFTFSVWLPPAGNSTNQGWNLAPFAGDNRWWLIGSEGAGNTIFQTADLSTVFQLSLT